MHEKNDKNICTNNLAFDSRNKDDVTSSDEPASKRARADVSMADLVATATTKVKKTNIATCVDMT